MAIRIRKVNGEYVAICAVESDAKKDDIYLDDGMHGALSTKFAEDFNNMFGDTFVDAVQSHTNNAKENVNRIENALDNNNANELEHAAHSLKGASGQFGAVVLSELAKRMEQYGKDAAIDKAKNIFVELKTAREEVENLMMQEIS